jgi:hypothetical protein
VKAYFSVCSIYRDMAHDLREWIEFHRLVGAERFFLYDNESVDNHREVLRPYLEDGTVVLHDWPWEVPVITRSIQHCLDEHRHESRWIAFLDTDEFLFSPTMKPLTEILPEYEEWPGVGVNQKWFGPSGHRTRPPGSLAIDVFRLRSTRPITLIKSIVDPARVAQVRNPHSFIYREGFAVDENKRPISNWDTEQHSCSILRINHYLTKSVEEFELKHSRLRPDTGTYRSNKDLQRTIRRLSAEPDDLITAYLPALRQALAARDQPATTALKGAGGEP